MKIVFDDAAEYQAMLSRAERSGKCPREFGLEEIKCTVETVIHNVCAKCWENALKEIAEVRHYEDHI